MGQYSSGAAARDERGRQLGAKCPKLRRKGSNAWRSDHGSWAYQMDLPEAADGRRQLARRAGLPSQTAAQDDLDRIRDLLGIADPDDAATRRRITTLVLDALREERPLPEVEEIRRRYQRRADLNPQTTVGSGWPLGSPDAASSPRTLRPAMRRTSGCTSPPRSAMSGSIG